MVKNCIKVYARIKRNKNKNTGLQSGNWYVSKYQNWQEIILETDHNFDYKLQKNKRLKFRFSFVFDQNCTQKEMFVKLAEPVINRVLEGYNGTIFAYGQTGSGKTHSITGASDYESRGLIPRAISHVFDYIQNNTTTVLFTICISYFEIYNEIAYDLLNPKHRTTRMEDLPHVNVLEDSKGETHLRNLNIISVASEEEAMNLLFLGDTNRTIAETPLNLYSSRSHCIFTIYVSAAMTEGGKVRRSKLHLVDLAGSESIRKSKNKASILSDTKQINLSLYYLEQVIKALLDRKVHVPYRNSLMTTILKDSLGGNCLTVMLATLSLEAKNFEETICTCKFAQRVAMVSTEPIINEINDPTNEIVSLKNEIQRLNQELILCKKQTLEVNNRRELTETEMDECHRNAVEYLNSSLPTLPVDNNVQKTKLYLEILKRTIFNQKTNFETEIKKYQQLLKQKDNDIAVLKNMVEENSLSDRNVTNDTCANNFEHHFTHKLEMEAFESFKSSSRHNVELKTRMKALQSKYVEVSNLASKIQMCKKAIISIKQQIRDNIFQMPETTIEHTITNLKEQQNVYRESILKLHNLKHETEHLKHAVNQSELRLIQAFKSQQEMLHSNSNRVQHELDFDFRRNSTKKSELALSAHLSYENETPQITGNSFCRNYDQKQPFENFSSNQTLNFCRRQENSGLKSSSIKTLHPNSFQPENSTGDYFRELTFVDKEFLIRNNIENNFQISNPETVDKSKEFQPEIPIPEKLIKSDEKSKPINYPDTNHFPEMENNEQIKNSASEEFLKDVPLTGDPEVDPEIIAFYKLRQNVFSS